MFQPASKLLAWYDQNYRRFPWRAAPCTPQAPYIVWLSEIMLQQTTTTAVVPYFSRFLEKWPTICALAAADLDEIFQLWQGLGYYTRARNLHRCAQMVVQEHQGRFPACEAALQRLPGIGPYTSAAIAAIAFDQPAAAVDGNVMRVFSRLKAIDVPAPWSKTHVAAHVAAHVPQQRAGDYTQALMDLGATICTPKSPACALCPLQADCTAFQTDAVSQFPVKLPKKTVPDRYTVAFVLRNARGEIFLHKRPEKGLLAGLYEVPNLPWADQPYLESTQGPCPTPAPGMLGCAGAQTSFCTASWDMLETAVVHTFTHLRLHVRVAVSGTQEAASQGSGVWCHTDDLGQLALPTLMKKVLAIARPCDPWQPLLAL